jgi:hypothetical protein
MLYLPEYLVRWMDRYFFRSNLEPWVANHPSALHTTATTEPTTTTLTCCLPSLSIPLGPGPGVAERLGGVGSLDGELDGPERAELLGSGSNLPMTNIHYSVNVPPRAHF